jgi:hypothetical protein
MPEIDCSVVQPERQFLETGRYFPTVFGDVSEFLLFIALSGLRVSNRLSLDWKLFDVSRQMFILFVIIILFASCSTG